MLGLARARARALAAGRTCLESYEPESRFIGLPLNDYDPKAGY